ncbi:uncharacterized protein LOC118094545 [Zootoca vivipara]|uniref:uncharacterized protein LOC118094545 n=1 Tax=Zootoca vivipara TaxID=8524 RepID=UPI00293C12F5|nr:uncharacterized protein LOC118094545 [Zootoca vivipara]
MRGEASLFVMSSNELALMSALKSSFGKIHQSGLGGGINEWLKQFNQSASAYFQSTPAVEKPSCFTSTQNSYTIHHQLNSSKVFGNGRACIEARYWDSMQDSCDSRTYPDSIISQLPSITHQLIRNYRQPNTHLNNVMGECGSALTANIMSQLRGKDASTLTSMLLQLVPHYPDLQKIDIQALSEMNSQSTELAKICFTIAES